MAACIAIGNGATDAEAAKAAGIGVRKLRGWKAKPWWPRIATMAEQALPAADRRAMLQRKAERVLNRCLDASDLDAAKIIVTHLGLFSDAAPSGRLPEDAELEDMSTRDLVKLALAE